LDIKTNTDNNNNKEKQQPKNNKNNKMKTTNRQTNKPTDKKRKSTYIFRTSKMAYNVMKSSEGILYTMQTGC
jgi:hypothetical protein